MHRHRCPRVFSHLLTEDSPQECSHGRSFEGSEQRPSPSSDEMASQVLITWCCALYTVDRHLTDNGGIRDPLIQWCGAGGRDRILSAIVRCNLGKL